VPGVGSKDGPGGPKKIPEGGQLPPAPYFPRLCASAEKKSGKRIFLEKFLSKP